ncbi:MAG: copper-binding protein [Candidatus Rokubacteria bacterium]|nr:copper-binding protein [Candidatus Rokubacteria bacterium]
MPVTRCCVVGLVVGVVVRQGAAGATSKPDYQGTAVTMSMPFIAAPAALFTGLKAGDRVAFGLKVTPDALLVIALRLLQRKP